MAKKQMQLPQELSLEEIESETSEDDREYKNLEFASYTKNSAINLKFLPNSIKIEDWNIPSDFFPSLVSPPPNFFIS